MPLFKSKDKKAGGSAPLPDPEPAVKQLDRRVGLDTYRDFFTLKNYWKAVGRRPDAALIFLHGYLSANPSNAERYAKLKNVNLKTLETAAANSTFEAVAGAYLKVFEDVIAAVEEKPGDVQAACDRLIAVGKMHRSKVTGIEPGAFQAMEAPFLAMVSEVLQDRYNDKAETLFRKFYQFCLTYILEGFNG